MAKQRPGGLHRAIGSHGRATSPPAQRPSACLLIDPDDELGKQGLLATSTLDKAAVTGPTDRVKRRKRRRLALLRWQEAGGPLRCVSPARATSAR